MAGRDLQPSSVLSTEDHARGSRSLLDALNDVSDLEDLSEFDLAEPQLSDWEIFKYKTKKNPLLPIGVGATGLALGYGIRNAVRVRHFTSDRIVLELLV